MRFQPQDEEFQILDKMDEYLILAGGNVLFWKVGDLVSLSYKGYLEIAKTNGIAVLNQIRRNNGNKICSLCSIRNPRTRWTGFGAAQCEKTLENEYCDVAFKKAFRNAVRLSLPPYYLRKCLKSIINHKAVRTKRP